MVGEFERLPAATITPDNLNRVAAISEAFGRLIVLTDWAITRWSGYDKCCDILGTELRSDWGASVFRRQERSDCGVWIFRKVTRG